MKCDGLSNTEETDSEIQAIIEEVRQDVETNVWHLISSFLHQIVAETNYFVKVNTGDEYLHLRIFSPLPCTVDPNQLTYQQRGKLLRMKSPTCELLVQSDQPNASYYLYSFRISIEIPLIKRFQNNIIFYFKL